MGEARQPQGQEARAVETAGWRVALTEMFFSSTGRSGRGEFMLGAGTLVAVLAAFDYGVPGSARSYAAWAVVALLVFCGASVIAKRLHDRGRAGWWSGVVLLAFIWVWPRPQGVLDWVGVAILATAFIDLALMPGQKAFNRFGPPPR